jgi:hypothetical protein
MQGQNLLNEIQLRQLEKQIQFTLFLKTLVFLRNFIFAHEHLTVRINTFYMK